METNLKRYGRRENPKIQLERYATGHWFPQIRLIISKQGRGSTGAFYVLGCNPQSPLHVLYQTDK